MEVGQGPNWGSSAIGKKTKCSVCVVLSYHVLVTTTPLRLFVYFLY
jgi:hypothetical protein